MSTDGRYTNYVAWEQPDIRAQIIQGAQYSESCFV